MPWRVLAAAALLASASAAHCQTSYPFLHSLYPSGLQRGQTVEVTLSGLHNYHGAYKVLVEGAGLEGVVVPPEGGWPAPDPNTGQPPAINEIKLRFTAAPDARQGLREVRVVTPRGASSVGQMVIGDEPELLEAEPNNALEQAQEIPVPAVVNGRIQQGEDVDSFRLTANEGEQITFAVLCARLQDRIHDLQQHAGPILVLRDATGREIASNSGYYRADPMLSHRFAKSGQYVVQIRDVNYGGNPHWVYRLTATRRPYVVAMLPAGARPGESVEVQAAGYNLGTNPTARLEVPADVKPGIWEAPLQSHAGTTNTVPVAIVEAPVTLAALPADGSPMPIAAPAAVSGRLAAPGEKHRFRLTVKRGQMYTFEVYARRLHSRIDSQIALVRMNGEEFASNDDAIGQDSRLDWVADMDGDIQVEVADLHAGGGEAYFYLLTVTHTGPTFDLRCDDDKMNLAPGSHGAWYVHVDRRFGFNAPVRVEVQGLPPGVSASPLTIPGNVNTGCLVLSAASDAAVGANEVQVVGTATAPGPQGSPVKITRRAIPHGEIYIPGGGRGLWPMNLQAVAVTAPADIQLELSPARLTLKPGESGRIDVTVRRRQGFTKPVTLDVILRHLGTIYGNPLPPGVTLDEGASKTLLGENETQGHLVLKAAPDAQEVTDLPIAVLGAVSINFVVKVSHAGPPVLLTIKK